MSTANKFATDGKLGVAYSRVDDTALMPIGTVSRGGDDSEWVYCQLPAIVQVGSVCVIDAAGVATLITTANSPKGNRVGVAPAVATLAQFGWLQVGGVIDNLYVGASCVQNVAINTTATGGMLDDDASVGAKVINRAYVTTTRAASNGVAPGVAAAGMDVGVTL